MWDWEINWGTALVVILVLWYDVILFQMIKGGSRIRVVGNVNGTQAAFTMFGSGFIIFHPIAYLAMAGTSQNTINGFYDFLYWYFETFSIIGFVSLFN